ncbi:alpha/beta hydrolase [Nocardioides kribbensis]|uniref:alpha/beta hydrolase n=1 Tax=Nocardioides kribbensis TaxID=305517 RepID=UPI003D7FE649
MWAVEHAAELGADPERVAVMGESAGGNLAAVVALLARDRGGPRLRHQTLLYPATDLTEALREHDSFTANDHGVVVSLEDLEVFLGHYLPEPGPTAVDASDWRLSPLLAPDLAALPPALVVVAGLDPLHDSGVRYAEALAAAGVPARVEDFHRMPHGFLGFPHLARSARPAMDAVVAAQRAALR